MSDTAMGADSNSDLIPDVLTQGYSRFREGRLTELSRRYQDLANTQSPKVMVISCADSRVDPGTIFDAGPGELFIVRNVANLVPPFAHKDPGQGQGQGQQAPDLNYHGTSAAIEYAVVELGVEHLVVLGHGGCGGIGACLSSAKNTLPYYFIAHWVAMLNEARDRVLEDFSQDSAAVHQRQLEYEGVRQSLRNLRGFPFVHQAMVTRGLKLHGAWFAIGEAALHWMQPGGQFSAIAPQEIV